MTMPLEPRIFDAWKSWLSALATDAEAALAAAQLYASLDAAGRDALVSVLEQDAPTLDVPAMALFGPLLLVETDLARVRRIERFLLTRSDRVAPVVPPRTLRGIAEDGSRVVVLVSPLYLSFVEVLTCRFEPGEGFASVEHEALARDALAPAAGSVVAGVVLESTPRRPVIEELAHAVLAHRRRRGDVPAALLAFADLFGPQLEDTDEPGPAPREERHP